MFLFLVHSGLDSRSWGGVEGCRDHQGLQGGATSHPPEIGGWDGSSSCTQTSTHTLIIITVSLSHDLCLSGCLSLLSTRWVETATLFLFSGTRTSWWEKMTSRHSATCTNLPSCTTSRFDSLSRTTSTRTVVSNTPLVFFPPHLKCILLLCQVNCPERSFLWF